MAYRIKELKDAVEQQSQMIITLRNEKVQTKDAINQLYGIMVKVRPEYHANATSAETESTFPDMRHEDLARHNNAALLKNLTQAFQAVMTGLMENREELHSVYKELDHDVSAAMDEWNRVKAQDDLEKKRGAFREGLNSATSTGRAPTPDLSTPPRPAGISDLPRGDITPDSANKGLAREEKTGKSKGGTGTLEAVLGSPPTSPTSQKSTIKSGVKSSKVGKA